MSAAFWLYLNDSVTEDLLVAKNWKVSIDGETIAISGENSDQAFAYSQF